MDITIDWKDSPIVGDEIVTSPTFLNCKFVVQLAENSTMQYTIKAENVDGTIQPICVTNSNCAYMNHAMAITIAESLRLYYARLQC